MDQYLQLLQRVLEEGEYRPTRAKPTKSVFGCSMRFDLAQGFPLLTTKRLHWKSIVHELLWMVSGSTNVRPLQQVGVSIWDEWADRRGELGPIYGKQWRNWSAPDGHSVDQLALLIEGLSKDPFSRRHLLTAWNPADLKDMRLPPCHVMLQCWVGADGKSLHGQLYQRSADLFLGVPFNIASYSLLLCMIAQVCGMAAKALIWTGGDVHLYENHFTAAATQLSRNPGTLPRLTIDSSVKHIDAFRYEHFALVDYHPQPTIRAEVVV